MLNVRNVLRKLQGGAFAVTALVGINVSFADGIENASAYDDLVALFVGWRDFEKLPMLDGAPDYTVERFAAAHMRLKDYQSRLNAICPECFPDN